MHEYLALALGIILAGVSGELFVRGIVGLAHWARVSPGIIGATVAAFATSSPELTVAVTSALAGAPQIALGDALGSNMVNLGLILGIALMIAGMHSPRDGVKRDFPVALLVPALTGVLMLDGRLSRLDGLLLLGIFLAWLTAVIIEARRQRSAAGQVLGARRLRSSILLSLVGILLLVLAGRLIVRGATEIALSFGLDAFVIGATVVAVGTSMPELATTIIATLRRHDEVALGTILGSNIYNGLLIIAVAAIIHPIEVAWHEIAVTLGLGILVVACSCPTARNFIERRRGVLLLALYIIYVVIILQDR